MIVADILAATLSSLTLAALLTHAALNRPEPFTLSIPMDCFTFRGEAVSCRPHLDTPTPPNRGHHAR